MAILELTEEMIDEATTRAERVAGAPGDGHCYPFPDPSLGLADLQPEGAMPDWVDRRQLC
jgi:hypothetical protein